MIGSTKSLLENEIGWFQRGHEFRNIINDKIKKAAHAIIGHLNFDWS